MKENQSRVRMKKLDYHPDFDLLTALPLEIIHIILALIPIKEAVRTCILSKQWRYKWKSLPQLAFTEDCAGYENFISSVLFRHNGPIHKFKISVPFQRRMPSIDEWVYIVSRHGVKEIIFDMGIAGTSQMMRSSIYSCRDLTNLELHRCVLDPLPTDFKGFFSLKCLDLRRVVLPGNGIESLISICPLLERLILIDCLQLQADQNISAPNLKYLELSGDVKNICLFAPLLVEISVRIWYNDLKLEHQKEESSVCNFRNILGSLTYLEKLGGNFDFSKYLSMGIESYHSYLVFHHLKFVDLYPINFRAAKQITLLRHLLTGAPILQELNISCDDENKYLQHDASDSHLSFGFSPSFKLDKLRVFSMRKVTGIPTEMKFMKILVKISPMLEEMWVHTPYRMGSEEKKKLSDELKGCSCASPIMELCFF